MEPITAMLIASLVGSALSTGSGIAKGAKESKYQRELQGAADAEKKKQERNQRRAALARAIGAETNYMPQPVADMPQAPDLSAYDIASGVGQIGSQVAAQRMANPTVNASSQLPGQSGMLQGINLKTGQQGMLQGVNPNLYNRSIR